MPVVEIDGRKLDVAPGTTVLEAARHIGIDLPTLCHDTRLRPAGDCRICAVEIAGEPHPRMACTTAATDGMSITTRSPALEGFRRTILAWVADRISPANFDALPGKELHMLMRRYGIEPRGQPSPERERDLSHPIIKVDMAQCIDCFRCVRICDEVQGQFVWHAVGRGTETEIVPGDASDLASSDCVACGACVDTCPTAALTDIFSAAFRDDDKWTRSTCAYCGVGCEIEIHSRGAQVLEIRPAADSPVSKGHLCSKGRYAFAFNASPDRLRQPLKRGSDGWEPLGWDTALDSCAKEFTRIAGTFGPDAIGVLGSARATNEENYLLQKFARIVLGTNNVDCCARVCHAPSAAALKAMLGTGAATNSFDDIEKAGAFLIVGANPTGNHPVVGARIKQRVLDGAKLIVIDPRRIELADYATLHLAPRPGTNVPLLNALAHVIVEEELFDATFIHKRAAAWEDFGRFIAGWTPERAAAICGVPANAISDAARLYAAASPAMAFHGLGLTEHTQGTEGVMALTNLALLTGNLGKPGAGINPLRGQNNVQGAAHMGCEPASLTGAIAIEEGRSRFEEIWKTAIPTRPGHDLLGMIDAAAAGSLKALWVVGYDILATLPNMNETREALSKLEFIVVQDLFINETARHFAHMVLPAASAFEKDGTFMNSERRIQRVRKAVTPPGEALPDWKIVQEIAARMGHGPSFSFASSEAIWNEIRALWPDGRGIAYDRLEAGGLQWPCRSETDPGTEIMHVAQFAHARAAPLRCIDYIPSEEVTDDEFPFLLMTGRDLYQFNAGTMTMRTDNAKLRPTDTLDMAPSDAARLGLQAGARVCVRSRHGEAQLTLRLDEGMKTGEVFATFHDPENVFNRVTSPHRDRVVHAPEYKLTAVAVERLDGPPHC